MQNPAQSDQSMVKHSLYRHICPHKVENRSELAPRQVKVYHVQKRWLFREEPFSPQCVRKSLQSACCSLLFTKSVEQGKIVPLKHNAGWDLLH